MKDKTKILLVGCGSMGTALYKGWLAQEHYDVTIIDPHVPEAYSSVDLLPASFQPDVIVFAIKPQVIDDIIPDYAIFVQGVNSPLFLSIMAGVSINRLQSLLSYSSKIIRSMPNLPAVVGEGMTGLVASESLTEKERHLAEMIFSAVGEVVWMENEDQINAVTAISGSGPAYFFQFVEHLSQAGISLGLPVDIAHRLSKQTLIGAAEILKRSSDSAQGWRQRVTSPGGTTAAALQAFDKGRFKDLVEEATKAAYQRSIELS